MNRERHGSSDRRERGIAAPLLKKTGCRGCERGRVFVYCGGQRAGAFEAPSIPANFMASDWSTFGVMWRAADITTTVDASGKVTCRASPVTERALTIDDSTF